jgi:DNA-binding IclR family transcriptional regulator
VIKSVDKAFKILRMFNPAEPRLSLAEIADRLGNPKSTTYNLLATLVACGYVEKTGDDRYALGPAIIPLTQSVRVNCEIRDRVAPLLRELANISQESVYLTVPEAGFCLYIYAIETSTRLLARTAVGERGYLHRTAVGKAILAFMPAGEADAIIDRVGLPASTAHTITDRSVLQRELESIRERGYSLDRGENEVGTYCVGTPILDARGCVIASCSVSGVDPEIVGERLPDLAKHVMRTALEASRRMGYVPFRSGYAPELLPGIQNRRENS